MNRSIAIVLAMPALVLMFSCSKTEDIAQINSEIKTSSASSFDSAVMRTKIRHTVSQSLSPILRDTHINYQQLGVFNYNFFESRIKELGSIDNVNNIYSTLRALNIETSPTLKDVQAISEGYLTRIQVSYLLRFLDAVDKESSEEITVLYQSAIQNMSRREYNELVYIFATTEGILDTFKNFKAYELRAWTWHGWRRETEMFLCNMATNGVGAVWGSMGGAVATALGAGAIASGGIGIVIGAVGGYALGRVACP